VLLSAKEKKKKKKKKKKKEKKKEKKKKFVLSLGNKKRGSGNDSLEIKRKFLSVEKKEVSAIPKEEERPSSSSTWSKKNAQERRREEISLGQWRKKARRRKFRQNKREKRGPGSTVSQEQKVRWKETGKRPTIYIVSKEKRKKTKRYCLYLVKGKEERGGSLRFYH